MSLTDPESVFGLDKQKVYRPLYNVQAVRDLQTDLVLAYEVSARQSDAGMLVPMIQQTLETGVNLKGILVDAGYLTAENLAACERLGVTVYAPWQENSQTAKRKQQSAGKDPPLEKDQFRWDESRKVYICPAEKELPFSHQKSKQRASGEYVPLDVYQAQPTDCSNCPLQARCTSVPHKGRSIQRQRCQGAIDRLQDRMQTAEAKAHYKRRGQTIERLFGDFKEHRNMHRFRGRGVSRARAQTGLTVLAHNIRIVTTLLETNSQEIPIEIARKTAA